SVSSPRGAMETDSAVQRVRGVCAACGKEQQLADARQVHVCRHCGGPVRAEGTEGAERRHASEEIRRAADIVRGVRFYAGLVAVLALLGTAHGIYELSLPNGTTSFARVAACAGLLLVTATGHQLVRFHPFRVSLVLALACTVTFVPELAAREVSLAEPIFAVGFLACAIATRRTESVVRAHPELLASRQLLRLAPR